MQQEFFDILSKILDDWDDYSSIYGEKFNNTLQESLNNIESEEFNSFYNEIHEDTNICLSIFEIEAEKIRNELEKQLKLETGKPSNLNLEERKFNLLYYLNPQEVEEILKGDNQGYLIKKSLIAHQEVIQININENLTLNPNLIRIIKFDSAENQDPEKNLKLFVSIFSKALQINEFLTIPNILGQFEQYFRNYNTLLIQNNIDDYVPFHWSDDISSTFIAELNKNGYLFLENIIINELNKKFGGSHEFVIDNLKISDESNINIWYEINDENYKEILRKFDIINPVSIKIHRNAEGLEMNCYFLPKMEDQNIFQMKFFDEIITARLMHNNNTERAYFLLEELREKFELEFNKLIEIYDLVHQEHFLSNTRIKKYMNKKLQDDNFLKNFLIINPFINKQLESDLILSKYNLFNPNKMKINAMERNIEIKLSKKEILSLDEINDYKYITKSHNLMIDIQDAEIDYEYSFTALDQHGIAYIELLKYFFKNNKDYSSESFLDMDYEQFKNYIFDKYEKSKFIDAINRNLRNLNTFKSFLRELDNILKNLE
ncbi:MAG: hypothetical protein ACTSQS_16020 [Promethearchaeota archaeon]